MAGAPRRRGLPVHEALRAVVRLPQGSGRELRGVVSDDPHPARPAARSHSRARRIAAVGRVRCQGPFAGRRWSDRNVACERAAAGAPQRDQRSTQMMEPWFAPETGRLFAMMSLLAFAATL